MERKKQVSATDCGPRLCRCVARIPDTTHSSHWKGQHRGVPRGGWAWAMAAAVAYSMDLERHTPVLCTLQRLAQRRVQPAQTTLMTTMMTRRRLVVPPATNGTVGSTMGRSISGTRCQAGSGQSDTKIASKWPVSKCGCDCVSGIPHTAIPPRADRHPRVSRHVATPVHVPRAPTSRVHSLPPSRALRY